MSSLDGLQRAVSLHLVVWMVDHIISITCRYIYTGNIYCLIIDEQGCERYVQGCYMAVLDRQSNPPSFSGESDVLPLSHHATQLLIHESSTLVMRRTAISLVTLSCKTNCRRLSESAPSSAQRRHSCNGFSSSASRRNIPFSLLSSAHAS